MTRVVREVLHNCAARLCLTRTALAADHDRLISLVRRNGTARTLGDRIHMRRQHAKRATAVDIHQIIVVQASNSLVRVQSEQHGASVRVDGVR